jgi:exopolysaccharide biosynthesis protein
MNKMSRLTLFIVCWILLFPANISAQIPGFKSIDWKRTKVIPGLVWKSSHTNLDSLGSQNINILLVNLRKRELSLYYNSEINLSVDKQASSADALAAVNAGFFNIKEGGSVTYIRTDGKIQEPDTAGRWRRNVNMNGSVLIDARGRLFIDVSHTNKWYDDHDMFPDVLLTGPLLMKNRHKAVLPGSSLVELRHPRTAIGKKGRNRVLLITVDGRTGSAAGMTLHELSDLMVSLKCRDAVNLDGGGSTTMWISGEPHNGIVNMPSDNKKFDHEGARAVSDIIIVR